MPTADPSTRGGSDAPKRRRRGYPLRAHIALLFVALITIAGLALVGYGFIATSGFLLAAGDEEFRYVADRTAGQVRDLLSPARLLVQLLAHHHLTTTTGLQPRLEALPLLTSALADHPEISAVYVGFAT